MAPLPVRQTGLFWPYHTEASLFTQILASKRPLGSAALLVKESREERFRATACPDFDREFRKCKAFTKKNGESQHFLNRG
jgi:hypothetical protein